MRFFHHTPTAIGLDLGDRELKIVALDVQGAFTMRGSYTLRLVDAVPLDAGVLRRGDIQQHATLERTIRAIMQQLHDRFHGHLEVVIGVPESQSFLFTIDERSPLARDAQIHTRIEREVPLPIDALYFDSVPLPRTQPSTPRRSIVGAAPRAYVDRILALAEQSTLTVAALDFEGLATARAIVRALPALATTRWALIDFGATRTHCMIVDGEAVVRAVRLPLSGDTLTETIGATLHLTAEQAERTKRQCGIDPAQCQGALKAIVEPHVALVCDRVHELIYSVHDDLARTLTTIVIVGGGGHMAGLPSYIQTRLNIGTTIPSLFDRLRVAPGVTIPSESLGYATALGLALRAATTT